MGEIKKIRKAVIPAAGLGTRFLPATKAMPKEMLPIVDKPTIQYIVEEAVESGIESLIIVTGRSKRAIEDHFDRSLELEHELERHEKYELLDMVQDIAKMINISYVRQHQPKGLGHAVWCAKEFIGDEPFCILLGDNIMVGEKPALRQLIDVYNETGASVMGAMRVPYEVTYRYGIVEYDEENNGVYGVKDLIEKPRKSPPSNLALMGRYVVSGGEIFNLLQSQKEGTGGEIQLTDALRTLARMENMTAVEMQGKLYDVGDKMGFLKATCEFALSRDDLKDEFKAYLRTIVNE